MFSVFKKVVLIVYNYTDHLDVAIFAIFIMDVVVIICYSTTVVASIPCW